MRLYKQNQIAHRSFMALPLIACKAPAITLLLLLSLLFQARVLAQESCCEVFQPVLVKTACGDKLGTCCFELFFEAQFDPGGEVSCSPDLATVSLLSEGQIVKASGYNGFDASHDNSAADFWITGDPTEVGNSMGILCFEGAGEYTVQISWSMNNLTLEIGQICDDVELTVCCGLGEYSLNTVAGNWDITHTVNGGPVPRAASVLTQKHPAWADAMQGSNWISPIDTHQNDSVGNTTFQRCFCLREASEVRIRFEHRADDSLEAFLDGNFIGRSSVAHAFNTNPADTIDVTTTLSKGQHCITVVVHNNPAASMGLNIRGEVSSASSSLLIDQCCVEEEAMEAPQVQESESLELRSGSLEAEAKPALLREFSAYPNPSDRKMTTIRYQLRADADIELQLYDAVGRQAATLDRGRRSTGIQTLELNTADFEAGTYFLRLSVNGRVRSILLGVAP